MYDDEKPQPKLRRIDSYTIKRGARNAGLSALVAAATYALSMAGWWLQVHR